MADGGSWKNVLSRCRWGSLLLLIAPLASGCASIGPPTLRAARPAYNDAIADTARDQTFANLIRVHNNQAPLFLDVSGIDDISSLSVDPSGTATGSRTGVVGAILGSVTYLQTPTIHYVPVQGQQLIQQITTPITTDTLSSLYNSNWPLANILELAAQRMTPASGLASKAINNITTLDDLESIRITSTLSDLGSAVNSKSPVSSPSSSDAKTPPNSISIYFNPHGLLEYNKSAASHARKLAEDVWDNVRQLYAGTQPDGIASADRIELRVVPRSSVGVKDNANLAPVLTTRSPLGVLKSMMEGGPGADISFVTPSVYERIRSLDYNVWLVGDDSNRTFACPTGIFYTLDLELAESIKALPIGGPHGYDWSTARDVQRALQFANPKDKRCPHSIPGLTQTKYSDPMEEELLAELRLYILVIVDNKAPATAYVARTVGDQTYYIAGDDLISQKNLLLLGQFLTIQSSTAPVPTTTAVVVP